MKFIAEKVVHKPLVIAYHAEGPGWQLNATSSGNTKFWGKCTLLFYSLFLINVRFFHPGKSFEIIPTGTNHVQIGDDIFEWWVTLFSYIPVLLTRYIQE